MLLILKVDLDRPQKGYSSYGLQTSDLASSIVGVRGMQQDHGFGPQLYGQLARETICASCMVGHELAPCPAAVRSSSGSGIDSIWEKLAKGWKLPSA